MRRWMAAILAALFVLLLAACGPKAPVGEEPPEESTPPVVTQPEPEPEPELTGPFNPLTGLPIDEKYATTRPYAIMLNNIRAAMPQLGNAQADIIYEALAEGGITRMMGVYQSVEGVGLIGSVRSSRPYYLELALGHDAIYLHAGGSEDAYAAIKSWGVTALDCVNGPHMGTIFWRDQDRIRANGSVHSVVTSGEKILQYIPELNIRHDVGDDFTSTLEFADGAVPENGQAADVITVPFSGDKTGVFRFDEETGTYLVEQYGMPYIDGNDSSQVAVTNVIIIKTDCHAYDSEGRMVVDLLSGGEGWFACGGRMIPIQWAKEARSAGFVYTTEDGAPLMLGRGKSYVNIIPLSRDPVFE